MLNVKTTCLQFFLLSRSCDFVGARPQRSFLPLSLSLKDDYYTFFFFNLMFWTERTSRPPPCYHLAQSLQGNETWPRFSRQCVKCKLHAGPITACLSCFKWPVVFAEAVPTCRLVSSRNQNRWFSNVRPGRVKDSPASGLGRQRSACEGSPKRTRFRTCRSYLLKKKEKKKRNGARMDHLIHTVKLERS